MVSLSMGNYFIWLLCLCSPMSMVVSVHVCVCVCACVRVYTCVYTCVCMCVLVWMCSDVQMEPVSLYTQINYTYSRFLAPDSPLMVPTPFLFPGHLHGMTFPFLYNRNPLWTDSNLIEKHFFYQNCRPAMFSVLFWGLHPYQIFWAFAAHFGAV